MRKEPFATARVLAGAVLALSVLVSQAHGLEGTLRTSGGEAIAGGFIALTGEDWAGLDNAVTASGGDFSMSTPPPPRGHLYVQPPAREAVTGFNTFAYMPRFYNLDEDDALLDLRLPACGTVVLLSYDGQGGLRRFAGLASMAGASAPFVYVTDMDWNAVPAQVWHVYGDRIGKESGPREEGLPAVCVGTGQTFAVWMLFWPTPYGKLALRMDNAGAGYRFDVAGGALALWVEVELARTAVHDLEQHRARYGDDAGMRIDEVAASLRDALALEDDEARVTACSAVLARAVELRDELELAHARETAPKVRRGRLAVILRDENGAPVPGAQVEVEQTENHFRFGIFEGNPYDAGDFVRAREAGFNMGTVLPAWGWSDAPKRRSGAIDSALGIRAMADAGLTVKAHGVIWFQDYGILPDQVKQMPHQEIVSRALAQQADLLAVFGETIDLWEAINEPAHTNVVGLPRDMMIEVLEEGAAHIKAAGKRSLVNSPHEFSYGAFSQFYDTDNRPVDDYPMTYAAFLDLAAEAGAMDDIDIIGLQYYPGYRLGGGFAEVEGPAFPPSYVRDLLDRYARFGKTLHITEFSLPSNYPQPKWNAGYWREPWNEATQADYAEALYTIAFAHPATRSVTWWDLRDSGAAVQFGGLLRGDGAPKPVFERLESLLAQWHTRETVTTGDNGTVTLPAYGGEYNIRARLPGGAVVETTHTVLERFTNTVELSPGE